MKIKIEDRSRVSDPHTVYSNADPDPGPRQAPFDPDPDTDLGGEGEIKQESF